MNTNCIGGINHPRPLPPLLGRRGVDNDFEGPLPGPNYGNPFIDPSTQIPPLMVHGGVGSLVDALKGSDSFHTTQVKPLPFPIDL